MNTVTTRGRGILPCALFVLIVFCAAGIHTARAQAPFRKTYSEANSFRNTAQCVRRTGDGGFVMTGYVNFWAGNASACYARRTRPEPSSGRANCADP